jgi:hypothetical protein
LAKLTEERSLADQHLAKLTEERSLTDQYLIKLIGCISELTEQQRLTNQHLVELLHKQAHTGQDGQKSVNSSSTIGNDLVEKKT